MILVVAYFALKSLDCIWSRVVGYTMDPQGNMLNFSKSSTMDKYSWHTDFLGFELSSVDSKN